MVERRERAEEPPRRGARSIVRRALWALSFGLVAGLVAGVPEAMLATATRGAQRCLAGYEAPRGPERPACGGEVEWMLLPARVPWTAHRARYRAEELSARIAALDYVDAAVGTPSQTSLAAAVEAIERSKDVVTKGSQRLAMEDLGRSIGAPDVGRDAALLGDRQTLLARGEAWIDWRTRLAALRAALVTGDMKRAEALAQRYADFDPRDEDVRTAVSAVLCMGEASARGFEMLDLVQNDRAARRYEGMARDFGEVRALIVACAARAGRPPHPLPDTLKAGGLDASEARAVLRVELASAHGGASAEAAIRAAIALLEEPRTRGARMALLASVLAAGADLDAADAARLARPREGEAETPPSRSLARTALDWLAEDRPPLGDADPRPLVAGATYAAAARAVQGLEARKDLDKAVAAELRSARGSLWLEAAAALGREGDGEGATRAADEAAGALAVGPIARGLLRSNAYLLAGDRERALAELATDTTPARAGDQGTVAHVRAATLVQRAELLGALGRRAEAVEVVAAAERVARNVDPFLWARARWLEAVLATVREDSARAPTSEEITGGVALPWVGFANLLSPHRELAPPDREALINRALTLWSYALASPARSRRALRWAALDVRGDAPPWLGTHLALAGRLLGPGEGDPEVWLDAFAALDAPRFSLRQYAFARAEAARLRGDPASAARWEERYRTLRSIASDPARAQMARHLDL
ncbi:hypothetical protein [Polyangium aurulentum]|uniref:hypothetical protein n=1 Tax=Polyangium aurulentum TaxID=2567896 RepID=UPI0010AEC2C8|nr:hypothetical protein [Polyangium aurulentum]UQA57905.1 hypothetical protein E8A73_042645 [Polyangium aurulentum]